jgi:hypothetical protein
LIDHSGTVAYERLTNIIMFGQGTVFFLSEVDIGYVDYANFGHLNRGKMNGELPAKKLHARQKQPY